jgi:acyl transferase domain-containing protein
MGRPLLESSSAFRATVEACDAWVEPRLGWTVGEELQRSPEASRLGEIVTLQVVLFSLMVALAEMWRERGVEPTAVAGTSLGEVSAARVSGALDLEQALGVVLARAQLVDESRPQGGAVVVNVSEDEAPELLDGLEEEASIAGLNGPTTTSFAGADEALEEILRRGEARGAYCARINLEYPAHCKLLEPLAEPLRARLKGLRPREARLLFYSTVTGDVVPGQALDADYWVRNLLEPVRAWPTLERILRDGHEVILESTPHPIFRKPTEDAIAQLGVSAIHCGTLRRERDPHECIAATLAQLRERGSPSGAGGRR